MKKSLSYAQERLLYLIPTVHEYAIHIPELMSLTGFNSMEIKKVVQELREKGYPICSSKDGYWMTNNRAELKETINLLNAHRETLCNTLIALNKTMEEM